jgi:metal-sulfur cluster biosynthetic enzyme
MNPAPITEQSILDTLRQVIDPEIGCNIVDLGLIYGVAVEGPKASVQMTLTTQGCPMHESIAWGVKTALLNLEGIDDVHVEVVWDPPWDPSMMTDYGRSCVGMA